MRCLVITLFNNNPRVCNRKAIGTIDDTPICQPCFNILEEWFGSQSLVTVPNDPEEIDAEYNDLQI